MNPTLILIRKEIRDGLRNRWVLAITALLAMLALSLGFLGSAPTGTVKVDPLTVTVVSLSSLSIFLIPLIAMLLSYDAIVGEIDRGTMALLLSYPVARRQVMAGKFLGHLAILALDAYALVAVMTNYPAPAGGIHVVRPPGQHPARKIRVLTELLIAHFR